MAQLHKQSVPFTQVANRVLNDARLSCQAKGMFAYLFSKPDGWDFATDRIAKDHKDGRKAVMAILRELEAFGYLLRDRTATGKMEYHLRFSDENDVRFANTNLQSPQGTEALRFFSSPKELIKNKEVLKKETKKKETEREEKNVIESKVKSKEIVELIDAFRVVNPSHSLFFARPPQRSAAERLLSKFPLSDLLRIVSELPETNKMRYFPSIISPVQLEEKMASLMAAVQREESTRGNESKFSFQQ